MHDKQFRRWGETNSPCNKCTLRFVGCHGDCPKDKMEEYDYFGYVAFKSMADEQHRLRNEFLKKNDMLADVHKRRRRR